jgi:uncharacterized protein (DUF1501 family)
VTGNAVFLSGDTAIQYQVGTGGAIPITAATSSTTFGSTAVSNAMRTLVQQQRGHVLENEYNKVTARSIASQASVTAALAQSNAATPFTTVTFPAGNSLADQLKVVARLIKGKSDMGVNRQVFLVSLGGFDTHDFLARDHGGFKDGAGAVIPGLMGKVSAAMTAFYNATVEMGLAEKVTAFTASDFGRTLASNGDGSDHGWGSHHLVVGGAVAGKQIYGEAPPVSVSDAKTGNVYNPENQWHVGQGRLLPTTSVDEYAATMARWFGVAESEMTGVLPKIGNFGGRASGVYSTGYLGFMNPS